MKKLIITALLLYLSLPAYAEKNQKIDDLSVFYAECASYLEMTYAALERSNVKQQTLDNAYTFYQNSMVIALALAADSRDQDMAVNVTHSRMELFKKEMSKRIDNNFDNFSILMNEYNESCINVIKNPDPLAIETIKKIAESSKLK